MEDGISVRQKPKQTASVKPFVSVVTVTYNAREVLERTIKSVINQTLRNREYIIVDGGSSDGTLEIIKKYEAQIDYWVSEPDDGVYHAMNRALDLCSGEWINFMNAGDTFYTDDVLADIFDHDYAEDVAVIYGQTKNRYDSSCEAVEKSKPLEHFYQGKPFCHQSAFARTDLMKIRHFDIRFKIAADYDFFYKLFVEGQRFVCVDTIVAKYDMHGISSDYVTSFCESREVVAAHAPEHIGFYSRRRLFMIFLKKYIKKILPAKVVYLLRMKRLS